MVGQHVHAGLERIEGKQPAYKMEDEAIASVSGGYFGLLLHAVSPVPPCGRSIAGHVSRRLLVGRDAAWLGRAERVLCPVSLRTNCSVDRVIQSFHAGVCAPPSKPGRMAPVVVRGGREPVEALGGTRRHEPSCRPKLNDTRTVVRGIVGDWTGVPAYN